MTEQLVRDALRDFDTRGYLLRDRIRQICEMMIPVNTMKEIIEYMDVVSDLCDIAMWLRTGDATPPHIIEMAARRLDRMSELHEIIRPIIMRK